MFCDACGMRVDGPANFCPRCGRTFQPAGVAPPSLGGRVVRHVRTLGILWLVFAGLRLTESLAAHTFANVAWGWGYGDFMPGVLPPILHAVGGVYFILAVVGAITGWGLLERRPWARTLAIVIGILALFKFPIGTALGIYTLWVLAPAASEMEYRIVQREG